MFMDSDAAQPFVESSVVIEEITPPPVPQGFAPGETVDTEKEAENAHPSSRVPLMPTRAKARAGARSPPAKAMPGAKRRRQ